VFSAFVQKRTRVASVETAEIHGMMPDFATNNGATWKPAKPNFLESARRWFLQLQLVPGAVADWLGGLQSQQQPRAAGDGAPHELGGAALHETDEVFCGVQADGSNISGTTMTRPVSFSRRGVAAMVTTNQAWLNATFGYAMNPQGRLL